MSRAEPLEITLRTLTPLWTGGVDGTTDRLHETGLIGSLRWWYEALVRGLGGYACDPTSDDRCEYDPKKPTPPEKQLCVACYLFGCTGWARKFRLQVVDEQGAIITEALDAGKKFTLRFVELRPLDPAERWLLMKAVEIAVKYGALGGKTTLKPQKGAIGKDYGIVQCLQADVVQKPDNLEGFLTQGRVLQQEEFANLKWFFFIQKAFLSRLQMNPLLGLDENGRPLPSLKNWQQFLQGRRGSKTENAVSKKIFSFRAGGRRIWGYAKNGQMRDTIIEQIKRALGQGSYQVKTGEEVCNEL